jgi:hypothetical protein
MLKGIAWKFRATLSRGLDRLSTRIVVPPRTPATLTVCKNKHGSAEFAFPLVLRATTWQPYLVDERVLFASQAIPPLGPRVVDCRSCPQGLPEDGSGRSPETGSGKVLMQK